MRILIPAKSDGNDALNAFALGILALIRRPNVPLQLNSVVSLCSDLTLDINFLSYYKPILPLVNGAFMVLNNQANLVNLNHNLRDQAVTYTNVQEKLAPALRSYARALLQAITNRSERKLLYKVFKCSFLRYCAKKFDITISEKDYNKNIALMINNVYIFDKIMSVQNTFGTIFSTLDVIPDNLQRLRKLLKQPTIVSALRFAWRATGGPLIRNQYLDAVDNGLSNIGEIELKLLSKKFEVNLKIQRMGKIKCLTNNPAFANVIILHNEVVFPSNAKEKTSWSLVLSSLPIANLKNYDWCMELRRCYQFLDKLFDKSIYNLGFDCNNAFQSVRKVDGKYVDFQSKKRFFKLFRKKFKDEQSQIYGWRGLANWVIKKDIEARKNKQGDGLNHTMEEFLILVHILEAFPAVTAFAEQTSISNSVRSITDKLIDVTIANFTYRTQRKLRKQRYKNTRYIEYASDPAKFIMCFHLDINNKKNEKKITRKLGISKDERKWRRQFSTCCGLWTIFCHCCKTCGKADGNLYTYDGWSLRNIYIACWLLVLSLAVIAGLLISFILPRAAYSFTSEPDNSGNKTAYEILNPVASMIVPIAVLVLGAAGFGGWNTCHNWKHDTIERDEYHKDIAKILYQSRLANLLERVELEVEERLNRVGPEIIKLTQQVKAPVPPAIVSLNKDLEPLKNKRINQLEKQIGVSSKKSKDPTDKELIRRLSSSEDPRDKELIRLKAYRDEDKLHIALDLLLWAELKQPNVNNEIEEAIIKHINEAIEEGKNPIEDIMQNSGEDLQKVRIRRAYIKWDAGVKIKEELEKRQQGNFYWHYGFFKQGNWGSYKPNEPSQCYTFDQCSNPGIGKVKRRLTM